MLENRLIVIRLQEIESTRSFPFFITLKIMCYTICLEKNKKRGRKQERVKPPDGFSHSRSRNLPSSIKNRNGIGHFGALKNCFWVTMVLLLRPLKRSDTQKGSFENMMTYPINPFFYATPQIYQKVPILGALTKFPHYLVLKMLVV